jgi:DtxR family transcriptional regulator, Mn-dependent transcriptional regulator
MPTSEAVDDYLKAVLELSGRDEDRVTSNALAAHLGVRAASVTGMLQKLAAQRPPLVIYEKHRGVRLSPAGKRRAWELVRHHRLLELFLHDVLHYSWDEVHEEAERLEHFISERFEDRVAALLGDPEVDPHGHLIPQKHASAGFSSAISLLEWPEGQPAIVESVGDRDAATLRELQRLQLRPGISLVVEHRKPGAVLVRIGARGPAVRLSNEVAERVLVMASGPRPLPSSSETPSRTASRR